MTIQSIKNIKGFFLNNSTVKQTIFKNTFWLALAASITRLSTFILLIYAARILGATEYGKFNFALSFVSLFVAFHSSGLLAIVTREFSGEKEKREDFYSVISLKILLSVLAIIFILIGSFFITSDPNIQKLILILALYTLVNSCIGTFFAFFQARQKMEYQALSETVQAILTTLICIFFLFKFPSVENLSWSYLFTTVITLLFIIIFFNLRIFPLKILWDKAVWLKFLILSWPLALSGFFDSIYTYIDSTMLGHWGMITETGWYNAAYRIIFVTLIPVGWISGSFYPILSDLFRQSKEKIQNIWNYQMEFMILLAFPLTVGGMALASKIITFFYPSGYDPAIKAFQILIVVSGLIFLYRPFYDIIVASNQQKKISRLGFIGASSNIILNLILIPQYKLYGAAVATLVSYILILLLSLKYAMEFTLINPFNQRLIRVFINTVISTALMYLVITQPMIYNLNVIFSILIGCLTYFLAFFVIKKIINLAYEKV